MNVRQTRRTCLRLAGFSALLLFLSSPVSAQQPMPLLTPAAPPITQDQRLAAGIMDVRYVRAHLDAVGALEGPPAGADRRNEFALDIFDRGTFVATPARIDQTADRRFAWSGYLRDVATANVTLVIDTQADTITGTIAFVDATYQIRPVGDGLHAVVKLDPAQDRGDIVLEAVPDVLNDAAPQAFGDDGTRIDVMVVYTPAARIAAGGTAAIKSLIDLAVAETNQSYANSGIAPRLRLVHKTEVRYTESGDFATDLSRLRLTSDGYIDNVHALRDQYGADMVSMIVEGDQLCGIATLGGPSTSYAPLAFQVTARNCATGYYTFGHEFGHIQGARHDWYVDPTDNSPYPYNHGHYDVSAGWRDVMSYSDGCLVFGVACVRIPYWSNPDLAYSGAPLGVPLTSFHPTDNRRTLNNTAFYVANFRQEISEIPGATVGIAPSGAGAGSAVNPTYIWRTVPSATAYYLWVSDSAGNAVIKTWYNAAAVCGISSCGATPKTLLRGGEQYTWWVQTWNVTGYGPWSSGLTFVTPSLVPAAATLESPASAIATSSPTFVWSAVSLATHYLLWVNDSSGTRIQTWYQAATVGCGSSTGSCTVNPGITLANGSAIWWIQTWNAIGGYGPWSVGMTFSIEPTRTPGPGPMIVSPGGTPLPGEVVTPGVFQWRPVFGATHYYLWVNDSTGMKIQRWYQAAAAECPNGVGLCNGGPIAGQNLASGTITWWVQAWNASGGYTLWSVGRTFTYP